MTPILKLFEKSFEAYKAKFKILTKISLFNLISMAVMMVASGILAAFIIMAGFFSVSNGSFQFSPAHLTVFLFGVLIFLIGIFISIAIGLLISASTFFAVKEADNSTKIKEILSIGWKNIWPLFWVAFLAGLAMLGGFILFIIPGIIFGVWFSMSIYVFVFEGVKGSAALSRSKALVKGNWWPVFGRFLVLALISWLVSSIRFLGAGPIINLLFVTPFGVVYGYMIYQDLKK